MSGVQREARTTLMPASAASFSSPRPANPQPVRMTNSHATRQTSPAPEKRFRARTAFGFALEFARSPDPLSPRRHHPRLFIPSDVPSRGNSKCNSKCFCAMPVVLPRTFQFQFQISVHALCAARACMKRAQRRYENQLFRMAVSHRRLVPGTIVACRLSRFPHDDVHNPTSTTKTKPSSRPARSCVPSPAISAGSFRMTAIPLSTAEPLSSAPCAPEVLRVCPRPLLKVSVWFNQITNCRGSTQLTCQSRNA